MAIEPVSDARIEAFGDALESDRSYFLTSSRITDFTDLAAAMDAVEPTARLQVLTDGETIAGVRKRFLTASHVADLVEAGLLEIRVGDRQLPSLLLTPTELVAVVGVDDSLLEVFRRDESAFVEETHETVRQRFDSADPASLRAPAYSKMLADLGESLGETMASDVESMLDRALTTRSDRTTIDPVRISILAAAKNGVQLYELSRWGEDAKVGSRSKYSREKSRLEDLGIVDTEKINSGVGRPRQQLVLREDVSGASTDELVSLAESVLD